MTFAHRKNIRVAIIDNAIEPSIYHPVEHWGKFLDAPFASFRAPDGRFPALKGEFTHFILTGSEASIVEREPWVDGEVAFVQDVAARGFPLLGSCYGHQLIALALGEADRVRRCAQPEVGWYPIQIVEKSGLLGEKGVAFAFCSHFDEAVGLGSEYRVLASTPRCPIQAFELAGRPVWGIQFHPEIDIADARRFLKALVERGLPTAPVFAGALRTAPRDSGLIRRIVRHFLGDGGGK
ncbi:MAG: type 1 glutamine amidotransferase [Candidatus Aminicenantes bacterium]|nr:type 1 glutamine amidotransferase [Candidatus Aminicenantes bacterium]